MENKFQIKISNEIGSLFHYCITMIQILFKYLLFNEFVGRSPYRCDNLLSTMNKYPVSSQDEKNEIRRFQSLEKYYAVEFGTDL